MGHTKQTNEHIKQIKHKLNTFNTMKTQTSNFRKTTASHVLAVLFTVFAIAYFQMGYANEPALKNYEKSHEDKIEREIAKIKKYTELLKNAEGRKAETLHNRIENCQLHIMELKDIKSSQERLVAHHEIRLPFTPYEFDVSENSLQLHEFVVQREGNIHSVTLHIATPVSGKMKIDVVTPGGELIKSFTKSNYKGSYHTEISLNAEKGNIYFFHIDVDGMKTTKKVRFA